MSSILGTALACLLSFLIGSCIGRFNPNRTDYNTYGVKIAMNEIFLVLAQNGNTPPAFFLQFAPYNTTPPSSQCLLSFPDATDMYVYTVATGKKQTENQTHFFFAGELVNNKSGAFIGMARYNSTNGTSIRSRSIMENTSLPCDANFSYDMQYFYNFGHQEYFIIGSHPRGLRAYGFANVFLAIFDPRRSSRLDLWHGNLTWPDKTFIPNAVDISEQYGVVAGFTYNGRNATVKYSSMIYLLNFNASTNRPFIVDQYKPIPTPDTWQDQLTNADAYKYSAKYDMSVSLSDDGDVLVGMQFINRVFLFQVDLRSPKRLTFVNRHTNGRSLGNGKSIAWLQDGIAALIVNVYTLSYEWIVSQVHMFDMRATVYNSTTTPLSLFPNNHQKLPVSLDPVFTHIVSSPSSLALLDSKGHLLIFLPSPAGYYQTVEDSGSMPLITSSQLCMPGTYKNKSGVHDCTLCPSGTKNPGTTPTYCIPCLPESFCPLASVHDVSEAALKTILQAIPYPKSPDSVIFDEILLQNMLTMGSGRCLYISPLFWTLIVAGIAMSIVSVMGALKYFTKNPRGRQIRALLKCIFRHTDLIGEGELWVGGLASFSMIVLVTFACVFSKDYVKQYPIEHSSESYFACDISLRNAKFQTSVQSLAIPLTDADQKMFDLLTSQTFTMNIDFVNTLIGCNALSIEALYGTTWETRRWLYCGNVNSTLSLSFMLPYQQVSVRVNVADPKTIGALRIGLSGAESRSGSYALKELNFFKSFHEKNRILSRALPVALSLTKVVNETLAMNGDESDFGGIYIPTFTVDYKSLFASEDQFVRSTLVSTRLNLVITETAYYVKNLQQPIAKPSEVVFQDLLFTTVCLELFGLLFLSYKLIFKPLYYMVMSKRGKVREPSPVSEESTDISSTHTVKPTGGTHVDMNRIAYF